MGEGLSMFGTNSFNLVWEDVCKCILNNQLDNMLCLLDLPISLKPEYNKKDRLIDLIEKPFWSTAGKTADKTLIPDLITISKNEHIYDFIIFDAIVDKIFP